LIETIGCDVNVQDDSGDTPIHIAFRRFDPNEDDDTSLLTYLIDQKNVNGKIKKIVENFLKPVVKGDKNIASDTVENNDENKSIHDVKQPNEVIHDVKLTKKIEDKTPIKTEIIPDSQSVVEKQSHKNVPKTRNDKKVVHSTKTSSNKDTVIDVPIVEPIVIVSSETKQLKDEKDGTKKTSKDTKRLKTNAQIAEKISQNEVTKKTLPEATDANTNTALQVPVTVPLDKKIETEKTPSEPTESGKSKAKKVVKGKDDKKIEAKLKPGEIQSEKIKPQQKKMLKNHQTKSISDTSNKIASKKITPKKIEPKSQKNKLEGIKPELNPVLESKSDEKKLETKSAKSDEKIEEERVPKSIAQKNVKIAPKDVKNTKSKTDVESNPKLNTVTPVGIKEKDIVSSEQKIERDKIVTKINSQPTKKIAKKFGKIGLKRDEMVPKQNTAAVTKPTTLTIPPQQQAVVVKETSKTITTVEKSQNKANTDKNNNTPK
jgi:hypothetical protein